MQSSRRRGSKEPGRLLFRQNNVARSKRGMGSIFWGEGVLPLKNGRRGEKGKGTVEKYNLDEIRGDFHKRTTGNTTTKNREPTRRGGGKVTRREYNGEKPNGFGLTGRRAQPGASCTGKKGVTKKGSGSLDAPARGDRFSDKPELIRNP